VERVSHAPHPSEESFSMKDKDKPTFVVECPSCGEEQRVTVNHHFSVDGISIEDVTLADLNAKVTAAGDPLLKEGYKQLADRRQVSTNLRKAFAVFATMMQDELEKRDV
jgi:phage terminase large subunit GpA-like protein